MFTRIVSGMKAALFWVGVLLAVLVPVPLAIYFNSSEIPIICFSSGFLAVLFSKIEMLDELTVGPLKAKLRATINEAAATVDQLRALGAQLSEISLTMMISTEMVSDIGLKQKIDLHDKIIKHLADLGVSQEQLNEARVDWKRVVSFLYVRLMRSIVEGRESFDQPNQSASASEKNASAELLSVANVRSSSAVDPNTIREILTKNDIQKPELDQWLNDYEVFFRTLTIPRVAAFVESRYR